MFDYVFIYVTNYIKLLYIIPHKNVCLLVLIDYLDCLNNLYMYNQILVLPIHVYVNNVTLTITSGLI